MRWRQEAAPTRLVDHHDYEATRERQAVAVAQGSAFVLPVPAMPTTLRARPSRRVCFNVISSADDRHEFRKSP